MKSEIVFSLVFYSESCVNTTGIDLADFALFGNYIFTNTTRLQFNYIFC